MTIKKNSLPRGGGRKCQNIYPWTIRQKVDVGQLRTLQNHRVKTHADLYSVFTGMHNSSTRAHTVQELIALYIIPEG